MPYRSPTVFFLLLESTGTPRECSPGYGIAKILLMFVCLSLSVLTIGGQEDPRESGETTGDGGAKREQA